MPPRRSARAAAAAVAAAASPTPPPAAVAAPTKTSLPLKGCRVAVAGAFAGQSAKDIMDRATKLGAATTSNVTKTVTHLVTSQSNFDHDASPVPAARKLGIHILGQDWIDACEKDDERADESVHALVATASGSSKTNGSVGPVVSGKKRAASASPVPDNKPAAKSKRAKKDDPSKPPPKTTAADALGSSKLQDEAAADKAVSDGQIAKKRKGFIVPVDEYCNLNASHEVYIDDDGMIYDAALNQTNASNNNNKFYRIQILRNKNDFRAWTRWGRVGEGGQSALLGGGTLPDAIKNFEKKFKDKSGLAWVNRNDAPKPGKYTFIERNYDDSDAEEEQDEDVKEEEDEWVPPECTLEPQIENLMALIFNQGYMNRVMSNLNYDNNKLPLGKLSKSTILKGFQALKDLATLFDDPTLAQALHSVPYDTAVERLSNQYYSIIPHAFGRNRPPVINNEPMLKKEIELLESLGDMKEAAAIMKSERPKDTTHVHDRQFNSLNMEELSVLDQASDEFKLLAQYLTETKGGTHNINYKVEEIFRIQRQGEKQRFDESEYVNVKSDRRLLWHGSRTTNFGGILSQGLRIAPPEAPVSGYMFGKGIYLADMSSKSANYCCSYLSDNTALLLLCEAELGDPLQTLTNASYTAGETAKQGGMYSTWGQGSTGPSKWRDAGAVHPSLSGVKMPDVSVAPGPTNVPGAYLLYNEYIAYDVSQVRLRYLFRVKM